MEEMDAVLLLLAAIVETEGGEIRVPDSARVAVQAKALEVSNDPDGTLIIRLVEPSELAQMELDFDK